MLSYANYGTLADFKKLDDLGIAEFQGLATEDDGAKAGAADLVDPEGRCLDWNARGDGGLARGILPRAGGEDLAQNYLGDGDGIDSRTQQGFRDRGLAEPMRG